jgi:hypothetical protein
MLKYIYLLPSVATILFLLACEVQSGDQANVKPKHELKQIHHNITLVKEPWSGMCFAFVDHWDGPRGALALTKVHCNEIPETLKPLPTIPVYQGE